MRGTGSRDTGEPCGYFDVLVSSLGFFVCVAGPAPSGDADTASLRSADPCSLYQKTRHLATLPLRRRGRGRTGKLKLRKQATLRSAPTEDGEAEIARRKARRPAAPSCPRHLPIPCALISEHPWLLLSALRFQPFSRSEERRVGQE